MYAGVIADIVPSVCAEEASLGYLLRQRPLRYIILYTYIIGTYRSSYLIVVVIGSFVW